jgi:hypothetical protein
VAGGGRRPFDHASPYLGLSLRSFFTLHLPSRRIALRAARVAAIDTPRHGPPRSFAAASGAAPNLFHRSPD